MLFFFHQFLWDPFSYFLIFLNGFLNSVLKLTVRVQGMMMVLFTWKYVFMQTLGHEQDMIQGQFQAEYC